MRTLLILILAGFSLVQGGKACAHAVLLETIPSDRSVITDPPSEIILRFNEIVDPILIELRTGAAVLVPMAVTVFDRDIHIVPRDTLLNGTYIVSYRVTSADSHPVAGSSLFAVGAAPAAWVAPTSAPVIYSTWSWAAAIMRAVFLAAAMLAIGRTVFVLGVSGSAVQRSLDLTVAAMGLATAIAGIYLQGGLLLGADVANPFDGAIWRLGATSTRGLALLVAALGFVLTLARHRALSIVGAVLLTASFALSGHAATAAPRWIAIPTLLLHVAVVAFWLGSLVPLIKALDAAPRERNAVFGRFSDIAVVVVPQLVVAGAILAILQVQHFDALFGSAYSLILLVKLMLVGLLFTLAACNRWVLMPEMIGGIPGHARRFQISISAEIALGFAILVATAFLSQSIPPRSIAEQKAALAEAARGAGETVLMVSGTRKALLMVTPARAGRNTIRVRVLNDQDVIVDALEVTADLSNSAAGIEPLHRVLRPVGDGYFEYAGPELGLAGAWTVRIDALVSDFEKSIFETEISVK